MASCEITQPLYGDVSVFFSGGLDSTSVACMVARRGVGRVYLHTLDHGYGYLFARWAEKNLPALRRALGEDRIHHQFVDTKDLFTLLAVKPLLEDIRRYRATFGCCMGCTLAIATKTLIFNLERGIPHIMMGSSVGGTYAPQSMPMTVGLMKAFCGRYGVRYSTPLLDHHIMKSRERELLRSLEVWPGVRFLDKHSFGNQGYCLPSLQHLGDVLLNIHPEPDPDRIRRYFLDKQPQCEAYIERYFREKNVALAPLIEAMVVRTSGPPLEEPSPGSGCSSSQDRARRVSG